MKRDPSLPPPMGRKQPAWLKPFLYVAAIYHLLWALFFIGWPQALFAWAGMVLPTYLFLVQGVGAVLLMFSLGYLIAAQAAYRHVIVGLLAFWLKLMGAVGTGWAVSQGTLPVMALGFAFVNDVLWLAPLGGWLSWAYHHERAGQVRLRAERSAVPAAVMATARDQHGRSLADHQAAQPVLLVFLRHFGCTFCREALADLARDQARIEAGGTRIVLVHMSATAVASRFLAGYGLAGLPHISDPERRLYEAFALARASWGQVFGWRNWLRGAYAGLLRGHGIGRRQGGDGFQMPGAFVLYQGRIEWAYRHEAAADRPDYAEMASCEIFVPAEA